MPRDGRGTYIRDDGHNRRGPTVWQQAARAGVNPNAPDFDHHDQDIADALTQSLSRDGQTTPTRDLPMAGRKHTGVSDADEPDQYATKRQLDAATGGGGFVATADVTGTANGVRLSVTPSPAAYTIGEGYEFFAESENTGAMTLREGSKAQIAMLREDGSAFEGGEVVAGTYIKALYRGNNRFITNVGIRHWFGTKAAYDALGTKRDGVLYFTRE